jgi:hypothetical protein
MLEHAGTSAMVRECARKECGEDRVSLYTAIHETNHGTGLGLRLPMRFHQQR